MAGLYLHIPFCKTKCAYCDFFSIASLQQKGKIVQAICCEIELQKKYLDDEPIDTIYFGGGTPSVLTIQELQLILLQIKKYHSLKSDAEITLEANPDDLDYEYLKNLREIGVNRLSIGVQSFIDEYLILMKRRHNAKKAIEVISDAQIAGFNNISADLIYGLPGLTIKEWNYNLDVLLSLNIQHISAYHLTIEKNTLFYKWHNQQKFVLPTDEQSVKQFETLIKKTKEKGFVHYEISNFGLEGFFSKHNSNYWKNEKYLGLGPSAHSYNLSSRQWNIASVPKYMEAISQGKVPYEIENLTLNDKYNDYILTSLRTIWGINIVKVEKDFGKLYFDFLLSKTESFLKDRVLIKKGDTIAISKKGKFISDRIIEHLLYV
ncbi:MAG: radical SAM family heme chaperone HemW [Bacteroidales bacterium]|jgi:oxygen-independent coproporphyrinogen-3 oxidase|nr:radical SAM family heme chaperone HemW [Bacteroidales bacterium]